jgi:hypothetical protein
VNFGEEISAIEFIALQLRLDEVKEWKVRMQTAGSDGCYV